MTGLADVMLAPSIGQGVKIEKKLCPLRQAQDGRMHQAGLLRGPWVL